MAQGKVFLEEEIVRPHRGKVSCSDWRWDMCMKLGSSWEELCMSGGRKRQRFSGNWLAVELVWVAGVGACGVNA